jgi:hypothetical protein
MISLPKTKWMFHLLALTAMCVTAATPGKAAERPYMEPSEFIATVFPGTTSQVKVLWVTPDIRAEVVRILGHEPAQLRQKYWTDGQKTAWILDEIGKEDAITAGFVVKDGHIEQARVLVYRESRGGEIRYPSFVAQFQGATLSEGQYLNKQIDGISGATLSVNAMVRMSRAALYFAHMAGAK